MSDLTWLGYTSTGGTNKPSKLSINEDLKLLIKYRSSEKITSKLSSNKIPLNKNPL